MRYRCWLLLLVFVAGASLALLTGCGTANVEPGQLPEDINMESQPNTTQLSSPPLSLPDSDVVRQWANSAKASSEFASPEWSAEQILGEPDTPRCGDYQTAWASAQPDTLETIVVTYTLPVYVTGVNIYQSFNPNQVVEVEVIGETGERSIIYDKAPEPVDQPCPYILEVSIPVLDFPARVLQITIDQSVLGLGWNEIDAVELLGVPSGQ